MKGFKSKKGISLIVLVITIIVMIILAAAIILSLNNSGIIDKANKAKQDSDTANLKEYVNVLEAEWELMSETERAGKTSTQYVNEKLKDKYPDAALSADGEVYTGLTANARDAIVAGIKIGSRVKYEVTSDSKSSTKAQNGYEQQNVSNKTDFTWRFVGIGDDGELLIAPDMTDDSPKLELKGGDSYLLGPDEINRLCIELYSVTGKGKARSMNIEDVIKILGYTGPKGGYYDFAEGTYDEIFFPIPEALELGKIKKAQLGSSWLNTSSSVAPDGSDGATLKADSFTISSSDTSLKNKELVYYSTEYWLASTFTDAHFAYHFTAIGVRSVSETKVGWLSLYSFDAGDAPFAHGNALRPIVALEVGLTLGSDSVGEVWNLK